MTFLNPAVLIGLLAASIPVIIHLLNLRKLKKIEFSTLAFLKELQKNKIRKIKIKQWLLLALRVLIILFMVFAFARPALRGFSISGTTSAAKTSAVFIVDNSFSMSVLGPNGSYFNQAKDITKQVVEQMKEGDEASLIYLADKRNENNLSSDLNYIVNQLNLGEISFQKGDLQSALIKAGELVNQSKNFNREIYILSDLQKNIFPDENLKSDMSETLNEQVKIYLFPLAEKKVFNLGIDDIKTNTKIFEKGKPVDFTATVTNYSDQDYKNGVISLFMNNQKVAQKSFDVEAGKSVLINIEAPVTESGFIDVMAEIESDDIEFDNKRYTSFYVADKTNILLISDDNLSSRFIKLALQSVGSENFQIEERNSNQFNSVQIKNYDLVILCSDRVISAMNNLREMLKSGVGLMIIPPINTDLNNFNNLLQQLNIPTVKSFAGKLNDKSVSLNFDKIDFEHPLFRNIFQKSDKKNIESPSVNYFLKFSPQGRGTGIITLSDGSAFLSEFNLENSKVLLFNSAHDLNWNDFPLKTIYAPLMVNSVFYLSKMNQSDLSLTAGNSFNIELDKISTAQLKVVKPDNSEEIINLTNFDQRYFEYKNLNLAGIYKFYSGEKLIENIPVNHDNSESNPVYADKNDFEKYLEQINFKGKLISIDKNQNPLEAINQARFGSELWRIFLLIAIILAIIEMTIARNVKKDLEGLNA